MASEGKLVIVQGRMVWASGDLFKGKGQTIFGTNQPSIDPKTGEQSIQYGFGLSVPKSELADPNRAGALWNAMHEEAFTMFPSRQIPPNFAMKYKDGDNDVDDQGRPYSAREGYAGCIVFAMTTNLPIRWFRWENGQNVQVIDGIKCGDYVNVQVNIKAHGPGQKGGKAGLYLNPMSVQLVAPGKEIINAPTGDQVFGLAAPAAPPNYVPPPAPTMPPVSSMPAPAAPPAAPAPHHAVLPPAFQPPPGGQAAQYPPAPVAPLPVAPGFPPPAPAHPAHPGMAAAYPPPVTPGFPAVPR
jgi:hypothetical protein